MLGVPDRFVLRVLYDLVTFPESIIVVMGVYDDFEKIPGASALAENRPRFPWLFQKILMQPAVLEKRTEEFWRRFVMSFVELMGYRDELWKLADVIEVGQYTYPLPDGFQSVVHCFHLILRSLAKTWVAYTTEYRAALFRLAADLLVAKDALMSGSEAEYIPPELHERHAHLVAMVPFQRLWEEWMSGTGRVERRFRYTYWQSRLEEAEFERRHWNIPVRVPDPPVFRLINAGRELFWILAAVYFLLKINNSLSGKCPNSVCREDVSAATSEMKNRLLQELNKGVDWIYGYSLLEYKIPGEWSLCYVSPISNSGMLRHRLPRKRRLYLRKWFDQYAVAGCYHTCGCPAYVFRRTESPPVLSLDAAFPGCKHFSQFVAEVERLVKVVIIDDALRYLPCPLQRLLKRIAIAYFLAKSCVKRAVTVHRLRDHFPSFVRSFRYYAAYKRSPDQAAGPDLGPYMRSIQYVLDSYLIQQKASTIEVRLGLEDDRGASMQILRGYSVGFNRWPRYDIEKYNCARTALAKNPSTFFQIIIHGQRRRNITSLSWLYERDTTYVSSREARYLLDQRRFGEFPNLHRELITTARWTRWIDEEYRSRGSRTPIPLLNMKIPEEFESFRNLPLAKFSLLQGLFKGWDLAGCEQFSTPLEYLPWIGSLAGLPEAVGALPTLHAGEDFEHPVSGLRRIWETLLLFRLHSRMNKRQGGSTTPEFRSTPRLGHALALQGFRFFASFRTKTIPLHYYDLVMNLAWDRLLRNKGVPLIQEYTRLPPQVVQAALCCERILNDLDRLLSSGQQLSRQQVRQLVNVDHFPGLSTFLARAGVRIYELVDPFVTQLTRPHDPLVVWNIFLRQLFVWNEVLEQNAVIETNPTSNVVVRDLGGYVEHPIYLFLLVREMTRKKLRVVICTDDPGLLNTNLAEEFRLVLKFWNEGLLWAKNVLSHWIDLLELLADKRALREGNLMPKAWDSTFLSFRELVLDYVQDQLPSLFGFGNTGRNVSPDDLRLRLSEAYWKLCYSPHSTLSEIAREAAVL